MGKSDGHPSDPSKNRTDVVPNGAVTAATGDPVEHFLQLLRALTETAAEVRGSGAIQRNVEIAATDTVITSRSIKSHWGICSTSAIIGHFVPQEVERV